MDAERFITAHELGETRSAAGYLDWFSSKHVEIGASDEGRRAYREREGLLKEFVNEALPIATICDRYFESNKAVFVTHIIGNQGYDAIIQDRRVEPSGLDYLEITQCSESFDLKHRMIYLNRFRHVPLFSELTVSRGSDGQPIVEVGETRAMEHGAMTTRVLQNIVNAAQRKSVKSYPDNTALMIVFDPGPAFRTQEDHHLLNEFVTQQVLPLLHDFKALFLSAGCGGVFLHYSLQNSL